MMARSKAVLDATPTAEKGLGSPALHLDSEHLGRGLE